MIIKKAKAFPAAKEPRTVPGPTNPGTQEERLRCIEALGERLRGHVQFMCQVGGLGGSSAEAKERAVTAFYERLVVAEGQLDRIQESLRLE